MNQNIFNCKPRYRFINIPKPSGGVRKLSVPNNPTKKVQRYLLEELFKKLSYPSWLYGLGGEDRNHIYNAAFHQNARWVLTLDLKDFFNMVTRSMAKKAIIQMRIDYPNLEILKHSLNKIVSFLVHPQTGVVPMGSPTSSHIASYCGIEMDKEIINLVGSECTYTRYIDDITISSNGLYPQGIQLKIWKIIRKHGFLVNDKKTALSFNNGNKQTVTGVLLNGEKKVLKVERKKIQKYRAIIHRDLTMTWNSLGRVPLKLNEIQGSNQESCRILGILNYLSEINKTQSFKMLSYVNKLLDKNQQRSTDE